MQRATLNALKAMFLFVALIWLVQSVNSLLGQQLNVFGIYPRQVDALPGVLLWAFLHGSYQHLLMNTPPLFVMGFLVALRGLKPFLLLSLFILVLAGIGVWLFGRSAYHIGASGLVFGYFGFLVSVAWYERRVWTAVVASLVIFFYGGMIYGVLPEQDFVSWEGHLFGLLAGVLMAERFARKRLQTKG